VDEEDFEISTQPSPRKKSTRKKSRKSKKALDSKVEKEKMVMPQEEWGDSIQELHLENISKSLNQINSNLGKFKYLNKNLGRISNNFEETNVHLSWLAFAVKIGLFMLFFQILFGLAVLMIMMGF
jgi:hypothetical protein